MFAQLGAHRSKGLLQTFVKALNIVLMLSIISPATRETALEKRRRGFSGIPAELIRYADAVNFIIKLADYKQRAIKNAIIRQVVPSTDEIYQ